MASSTANLEVRGLGRQKITALEEKAKQFGMTPERYVKQLVEEDLAVDQAARTTTFDELLALVRTDFKRSGLAEQDLDALVDAARSRHHTRTSHKTKKR